MRKEKFAHESEEPALIFLFPLWEDFLDILWVRRNGNMMHQFQSNHGISGEVSWTQKWIYRNSGSYQAILMLSLAGFSILADMTSNRILAQSAGYQKLDRLAGRLWEKVIDIALKYGYESATPSAQHLREFHGSNSPQSSKWKTLSGLSLRTSIILKDYRRKENMDIKIQKKPAFTVAGVLLEDIDNSKCPSAWEKLYATHSFEA